MNPIDPPEIETDRWEKLGQYLDDIHKGQMVAIEEGFVKSDWATLDKALGRIKRTAERARRSLRPAIEKAEKGEE